MTSQILFEETQIGPVVETHYFAWCIFPPEPNIYW